MDASDRLRLLFTGEDEALLRTSVGGLQPLPVGANQSNPNAAQQEKSGQMDDSDNDKAFEDEYLASFARAEKEAARKQASKKKKKNGPKNQSNAAAMVAEGALPAQSGPQTPLDDSRVHYFCPVVTISRYPYKYIHGGDADLIAKRFFDRGKFWERTWDLYYIHPPSDISLTPLILVPRAPVKGLLDDINGAFRTNLSIPSKPDSGVLLPFENDGTPQPQFLGTSTSREMKEELERHVPARTEDCAPPPDCAYAVDRSFAAFKAKIEAAVESTRRKSKAARAKKQREQTMKLRDWCRSLKRLQCYLGFRPRLLREMQSQAEVGKGMSWDEQQKTTGDHAPSFKINLLPLDVNQPAPFPFADEPIFICIDVESNEKSHDQITEIGISTLDTLDLADIPPGPGGSNWIACIRSRHFRVSEYSHVVNHHYIKGCPDAFEFGESEWISIKQAGDIVDSCFLPPYSADSCPDLRISALSQEQEISQGSKTETHDGSKMTSTETSSARSVHSEGSDGVNITADDISAEPGKEHKKRPRNLTLLGHDVSADITYMRKLGCKIVNSDVSGDANKTLDNQPAFLESIDTNILFRVLKRETQPSSLGKVLVDLGLVGWNLHNAGNDARYTMESMVGIAVKSRLQDGNNNDGTTSAPASGLPLTTAMDKLHVKEENGKQAAGSTASNDAWNAEVDRRVAAQAEETATRVREECSLWDTVLGCRGDWDIANDDVDGGIAPGIAYEARS